MKQVLLFPVQLVYFLFTMFICLLLIPLCFYEEFFETEVRWLARPLQKLNIILAIIADKIEF